MVLAGAISEGVGVVSYGSFLERLSFSIFSLPANLASFRNGMGAPVLNYSFSMADFLIRSGGGGIRSESFKLACIAILNFSAIFYLSSSLSSLFSSSSSLDLLTGSGDISSSAAFSIIFSTSDPWLNSSSF